MRIGAALLVVAALGVPAFADPPAGPSVKVVQGANQVPNAHIIKFTSGCTLTPNGSEADLACTGGASNALTGTMTATGDLPYSTSGTNAMSPLADVAAGAYLRSGGVAAAPLWSTLTLPNAATQGDILIATGSNTIGNLADVAVNSVLTSGGIGANPVYVTTLTSVNTAGTYNIGGSPTFTNGLAASGSVANTFAGSTGDFAMSTGSVSWAGASGKTVSLSATSGSVTLQASTTTQSQLVLDSSSARIQWGATNGVRVDSAAITLAGTGQSMTYGTSTGVFAPFTDLGSTLGSSSKRFGPSWFQHLQLENTTFTAGDFSFTGWGNGTITLTNVLGSDSRSRYTITSVGTGQTASPTWTITFKTAFAVAPICDTRFEATNDAGLSVTSVPVVTTALATTTAVTMTWNTVGVAPTAADTYTFQTWCDGT